MNVHVHILTYNEAEIIGYALRHYLTYAAKITVHDLGSTDGTQEIAKGAGATVKQHDCGNQFNDMLNKGLKQEEWKGSDADWVIMADADELIYFPGGAAPTLAAYAAQGLPVIKPYGYEMTSDVFPTGKGQIYDEIKHGARDDRWYAKPILFSPKLVQSVEFSTGAHTVTVTLKNRRTLPVTHLSPPSAPSCFLLHFHQIGPVQKIADKYDAYRARYSQFNIKHSQGNQKPGIVHALEKRTAIMAKLERVVA